VTSSLDKTVSFNLSDIGEGIREVTVKEWFVKEGDTVEQFDNLCEVQSDKASVTITSRYDGKITKIHHKIDEIALVGKPLLDFDVVNEDEDEPEDSSSSSSSTSSDSSASENEEKQSAEASATPTEGRVIIPATPSVRRLAKEHQLDLAKVPATGKNGRVLKGDILEFLGQVPPGTNVPHPTLLAKTPSAAPSGAASVSVPADRVEVLKGVRKAMLKSMTESLVSASTN